MIRRKRILTLVYLLTASLAWGQDEPLVEEPPPDEPAPAETVETVEAVESGGAGEEETVEEETVEEAPALPALPDLEIEMPEESEVTLEFPTEAEREAVLAKEAETISVDFPDEEIRTIIRNVAELYDLNVVIPDTLVGNTSIKLRNVTWQQVFEVILEPIGFTYVEDRNIIKIKSQEDLLQEPTATRVFVVDFASAGDIQASISPLVDSAAGGRIQVDTRSNSLVITERPSRMNDIQQIIQRLDRPTAQVMIESKFVEVTNRDITNLGVNWTSLNNFGVTAGPVLRQFNRSRTQTRGDTNNNTTTDLGDNKTDISTNANLPGGFTSTTAISNSDSANSAITRTIDLLNASSQGRVDSAVFSADAFNIVLSALTTLSNTELVSNPTVVTMNNTKATINVGEEFPVPSYTYNDERGVFEVSGFEFKPIGIIINVTPQVNSAGFITLDISPQVSSRTGTVNFGGAAGAEIPIIATRKTSSTITIKDGFTLAIGGLIEQNNQGTRTKVPFFGDIPGIGQFFKSKSKTTDSRNLIIFLTAKTLNPDGSTYKDVFSPRLLESMQITASDVPGLEVPESEQRLYDEIQELRDSLDALSKETKLQKQVEALRAIQDGGKVRKFDRRTRKNKNY